MGRKVLIRSVRDMKFNYPFILRLTLKIMPDFVMVSVLKPETDSGFMDLKFIKCAEVAVVVLLTRKFMKNY